MNKSLYVIIERDDEYGYEVFRGIAFTLVGAYSIIKKKLIFGGLASHAHINEDFDNFQLVKSENLNDFYKTVSDDVEDTDYRIYEFDEQGIKIESLVVFATKCHITETADEWNNRNRIS